VYYEKNEKTMIINIPIKIEQLTDSSFPGWIEFSFKDIDGKKIIFVEKIPIISNCNIDKNSNLPLEGTLECIQVREWIDGENRKLLEVNTDIPHGVKSSGGECNFVIDGSAIITISDKTHIDVTWHHEDNEYPKRLVSEIGADRCELRKLEFYENGKVGYATEDESVFNTMLGEAPVPSIEEINSDTQFSAKYISSDELEKIWESNVQ